MHDHRINPMTSRIGLIGDVHASPGALHQALEIFRCEQVDDIFCTGDIAGYFENLAATIALLQQRHCKTIIGNHDQAWLEQHADARDSQEYAYLSELPACRQFNLEGKSIYLVHAHPPDSQHGGIKLLDVNGELIPARLEEWREKLQDFPHDILIVGHTHQVYAEQLGEVFVINPGSSQFNHSCMILELPAMQIETYALENQDIIKSWNFSMLFAGRQAYPTAKQSGHD